MVNSSIYMYRRSDGTPRPIFTSSKDVVDGMVEGKLFGSMASVRGVQAVVDNEIIHA